MDDTTAVSTELTVRLTELSVQAAALHRDEVEDTLTAVVALARRTVRGVCHAGLVALDSRGAVTVASASGDPLGRLDLRQAANAEGPGVDALGLAALPADLSAPTVWAAPVVDAADLLDAAGAGGRWPGFAVEARRHEVRSALALPLSVDAAAHAGRRAMWWPRYALTLYGHEADAFAGDERVLAGALCVHAGVALGATRDRARLRAALDTRDVIGQAKGILMQRHALDADGAFARLVRASQHSNVKVRDVAAWLVDEVSRRSSG